MTFEEVRKRLEALSRAFTWPFVALLIAGGAMFTAIVFYAPADSRELLLGANGLVATIVGYVLRSPRCSHEG
jgi:membrane associated rhomboid family serine protease